MLPYQSVLDKICGSQNNFDAAVNLFDWSRGQTLWQSKQFDEIIQNQSICTDKDLIGDLSCVQPGCCSRELISKQERVMRAQFQWRKKYFLFHYHLHFFAFLGDDAICDL